MKKTAFQVVIGHQVSTPPTDHFGTILHAFSTFSSVRGFGPLPVTHAKVPRIPLVKRTENRKTCTKYLIDQQRYESLKANFKKVKIDRLKLKQIVRFSNKNICYQKSVGN